MLHTECSYTIHCMHMGKITYVCSYITTNAMMIKSRELNCVALSSCNKLSLVCVGVADSAGIVLKNLYHAFIL